MMKKQGLIKSTTKTMNTYAIVYDVVFNQVNLLLSVWRK